MVELASETPEETKAARLAGEEVIRRFAGEWTVFWLEAGQTLFKQGDAPDFMYIVRSGSIRITSGDVVYEDVGPGGIVGEMGLIETHVRRSATATALTESELVGIDEPRFLSLVARAPEFAMTVMRVLSQRLRAMDRRYQGADPSAPPSTEPVAHPRPVEGHTAPRPAADGTLKSAPVVASGPWTAG